MWPWEISQTTDGKVTGIFQITISWLMFRFNLCSFFDKANLRPNDELTVQFIWRLEPKHGKYSSGPHHFMCVWLIGLDIVINGTEIITAPPRAMRLESDQGGHEIHRSSSRDYKPRNCTPSTLKIEAQNELTTRHWLPGQTWRFVIKFINYGTSSK